MYYGKYFSTQIMYAMSILSKYYNSFSCVDGKYLSHEISSLSRHLPEEFILNVIIHF